MFAAYVIGYPVVNSRSIHISKFAEGPDDTGFIIPQHAGARCCTAGCQSGPVRANGLGSIHYLDRSETLAPPDQGLGSIMPESRPGL